MRTQTATYAKTHFGKILETSLVEPVFIEKSGRNVAVLISFEEYQRMLTLEDKFWIAKAQAAEKEGFIGGKAAEKLLKDILDAED